MRIRNLFKKAYKEGKKDLIPAHELPKVEAYFKALEAEKKPKYNEQFTKEDFEEGK